MKTKLQNKILNYKTGSNTSKEGLSWKYEDLSMNEKTYKLRKQVISIIYEAKKLIPELPRVEVRICDMTGAAGLGYLGQNVIRIGLNAINSKNLRAVVYHELGHAVLGLEHNKECPLMASGTGLYDLCRNHCEQIFLQLWKDSK
tara:strand:- start:119 stop:550 length:432 start_codon:yes stop_codon:yes gene_type:complete